MNILTNHELRLLREQAGVMQSEVGAGLGVSGNYVAKLEQGVRPITPVLDVKLRAFLLAALKRRRATVTGLIEELAGTVATEQPAA